MNRIHLKPDMTPAQKVKVLRDVVDWIEANPDKAIRNEPATDYSGFPCDPRTPSATCFCFVGRLQHITGLSPFYALNEGLPLWLSDLDCSMKIFIEINDGNPDVTNRVAALRAYINVVEERIAA